MKTLTPTLSPKLSQAPLLAALFLASVVPASAQGPNPLNTGKSITYPSSSLRQTVGSLPMNMILTPNGKYAITTDMGFSESLYVLNTTTGQAVAHLDSPNTTTAPTNGLYYGLAIKDNGDGTSTLYAGQGANATVAIITVGVNGTLTQTGSITGAAGDFTAGVALDGKGHLYVAINENYVSSGGIDASSFTLPSALAIYNLATGLQIGRYNFATAVLPVSKTVSPLGFVVPPNFAFGVAALADGSEVYVSSQRDGAVYAINPNINAATGVASPTLVAALSTGTHPTALLLNKAQTQLYVSNGTSDTVSIVNTRAAATSQDTITGTVPLRPDGPQGLPGVSPAGLALSADEKTLYVALGDLNAVGVISVPNAALTGYIPAGWYPSAVAVNPLGNRLLVANAKGTQTRYPNSGYQQFQFNSDPQYDLNLIQGNVITFPPPTAAQLASDTQQVLANNSISAITAPAPNPLAGIGLHAPGGSGIKHVIYIVKENRTYDQVLGDLPQGNGAPNLVLFGQKVTPNFHALAQDYVLLDNFYCCSEASGDGWPWSTQSYANEYVIKDLPYNYSGRGRNYDFEGSDNFYPTGGFPATDPYGQPNAAGLFPTGGPPITDVAQNPNQHIWDDIEKNVSLTGTPLTTMYRNYGFFLTLTVTRTGLVPDNYPAVAGVQPAGHDTSGISDYDFREFDLNYADSEAPTLNSTPYTTPTFSYNPAATPGTTAAMPGTASISRFTEFKKEFQELQKADPNLNNFPAFTTLRYMGDHTNGYTSAGPTPASHVADNDYAVGQTIDLLSHSPIWGSTAVFVIEDDAQDGPDHVDCHRSPCFVISPFIKKGFVDHTFYNTDSVLKTMEQLLGAPPLSEYDATANTIAAPFDTTASNIAPYTVQAYDPATIAGRNPALSSLKPGTVAYQMEKLAAKMDFVHPDSADPKTVNEMIWKSVKGMNSQMPAPRHSLKSLTAKSLTRKSAAHNDDDD